MAVNIAPVTLKVSGNADLMEKGLDRAGKVAENWAVQTAAKFNRVSERMKSLGDPGKVAAGMRTALQGSMSGMSRFEGAIDNLFGNPGKFLADNVLGGFSTIASRIPVVGGLLALPLEAVAGGITLVLGAYARGVNHIKEMAAGARAANISVGDFQVLAALTKDTEGATRAMVKFQHSLAKAAMAGEGNWNVFTKLGLNAMQLMEKGPMGAFGAFADKIKGLGDSFMQAYYAEEIFGRKTGSILPVLLRGSEGINKVKDMLEGFGAGVSDRDVANIRAVDESMRQFEFLKQGFYHQLASGISPIIAQFVSLIPRLDEMGISFKSLGGWVIDIAEKIAKAGAAMWEMWSDTSLFREAWGGVIDWIEAKLMGVMGRMKQSMGESLMGRRLTDGTGKDLYKSGWEQELAGIEKVAEAERKLRDVGKKLGDTDSFKFLTDNFKKTRERYGGAKAKEIQEQLDALEEIKKLQDSSPVGNFDKTIDEKIAKLKELQDAAKKTDMTAVWGAKAKELAKSMETPLDAFRDRLSELQAMAEAIPDKLALIGGTNPLGKFEDLKKITDVLQKGLPGGFLGGILKGGLDAAAVVGSASGGIPKLITQGLGKSFQDLIGKTKLPEVKFAGAAAEGSQEAYSAILQFAFDQNKNDPIEQLKAIDLEIKAGIDEQNRIGLLILKAQQKDPNIIAGLG